MYIGIKQKNQNKYSFLGLRVIYIFEAPKLKLLKFIVIAFIVINSLNSYCQDSTGNWQKRKLTSLVKEGIIDTKDVAISPIKWDKKEWIAAGSILTTAAVLYSYDDDIRDFAQEKRNDFSNDLARNIFDPLGDGRYLVGSTFGLVIYGVVFKKEREKNIGITAAKALAISAIYTYPTKKLFHRHRPGEEPHSPYVWDGPSMSHDFDSFYSGHTITAFTFATVISSEYKKHAIVPITMYSLATLTALSRINDDKHWATDVLIGAAMGYGIGKLVYNNDQKRTKFYPELSSQYMGMKLVFK